MDNVLFNFKSYIKWCKLMNLKPSHYNNLIKYKNKRIDLMELYLKLFNWRYNKTWIKKFTSIIEMDKFIKKLDYVQDVAVIEDSRQIYFPDYNER